MSQINDSPPIQPNTPATPSPIVRCPYCQFPRPLGVIADFYRIVCRRCNEEYFVEPETTFVVKTKPSSSKTKIEKEGNS